MCLQHFQEMGMIHFLDWLEFSPALWPPPSHGGWVLRRSRAPSNVPVLAFESLRHGSLQQSIVFSLVLPSKTGSEQEQALLDHSRWVSKKGLSSSVLSTERQGMVEREGGARCHST